MLKAGLRLGDFFLPTPIIQGRAIFNGRAIMASCVHIWRFNSRKSLTILMIVQYNNNVIYS